MLYYILKGGEKMITNLEAAILNASIKLLDAIRINDFTDASQYVNDLRNMLDELFEDEEY